ncbi:MAG: hypothetical protein M1825_005006 [Sarcosagium campestre]|nr:MAG: hypothetical protein M1825_005006 [Sarcosagium campestre]
MEKEGDQASPASDQAVQMASPATKTAADQARQSSPFDDNIEVQTATIYKSNAQHSDVLPDQGRSLNEGGASTSFGLSPTTNVPDMPTTEKVLSGGTPDDSSRKLNDNGEGGQSGLEPVVGDDIASNVANPEPFGPIPTTTAAAVSLAEHQRALDALLIGAPNISSGFIFDEPTANPSALESTPSIPILHDNHFGMPSTVNEISNTVVQETPQIRAFAKLEFDDGPFYMNTYSVTLGRDIRAARMGNDPESDERRRRRGSSKRKSSSGDARGDDAARGAASIVSDSGGIMGMDQPKENDSGRKRRSRKRSHNSQQTSSSSLQRSRHNSTSNSALPTPYAPEPTTAVSQRTPGAHPVDPFSLLPSPHECPLIPIHPPAATADSGGHRGISRKHVQIAFNFDKHLFELRISGRNGAFVDERWHAAGETIALRSGSKIQIGGVGVRFVLPDVAVGETGAENTEGSSLYGEEQYESEDSLLEASDDIAAEFTSGSGDEEAESESEQPEPTPPPVIPVKRGPGRPPKNGISKRQMQQQEAERKAKLKAERDGQASTPGKGKAGRPRKNSKTDETEPKPKRKYTKRKSMVKADGADFAVAATPVKEKKEKKPPKPPRSPSPVFDESKLTAEELQKPQSSYVVLIHDAISKSAAGAMSLPQIYRAIERKYPYYKLRVTTTGWQSSVRHNLSQHHAFKKVERDGKGWMWGIVPGVSIEKEKKRRPSPPPSLHRPPHSATFGPPLHNHGSVHGPPGPTNGIMGPPPTLQAFPHHSSTAHGYQSPYASSGNPGPPSNGTSGQHQVPPHLAPGILHRPPPPTTGFPANPAALAPPNPPSRPQQKAPPINRPAGAAPSTPQAKSSIHQDMIVAVQQFKMALTKSMQNTPNSEAIIQSAVNRALGLSAKSTALLPSGKEDPQEAGIMKGIVTIINTFKGGSGGKRPAASAASTAPAAQNKSSATPPPSAANPPPPPPPPTTAMAKPMKTTTTTTSAQQSPQQQRQKSPDPSTPSEKPTSNGTTKAEAATSTNQPQPPAAHATRSRSISIATAPLRSPPTTRKQQQQKQEQEQEQEQEVKTKKQELAASTAAAVPNKPPVGIPSTLTNKPSTRGVKRALESSSSSSNAADEAIASALSSPRTTRFREAKKMAL